MDSNVTAIVVGLATGLFTLAAVWITSFFNREQQAKQLEFESKERQRDRHAALRRDVYLPAAEAFVGMVRGLGKLLDLGVPPDEAMKMAEPFGATLTQVQMIASPATISRAAEVQRAFLETMTALHLSRIPIESRRAQIDSVGGEVDWLDRHLHTLRETQAQAAGSRTASANVSAYQNAGADISIFEAARDEARMRWLRLWLDQQGAQVQMARDFADRMRTLADLQSPLLAAIRGELEGDEALQLIVEEAQKTSAVGLRAITDLIPVIEHAGDEMRQELAELEQRRAIAPRGRN